jgi:hypothetical protein
VPQQAAVESSVGEDAGSHDAGVGAGAAADGFQPRWTTAMGPSDLFAAPEAMSDANRKLAVYLRKWLGKAKTSWR